MRIIWLSLEILVPLQFVMHVNAPKVTNCRLLSLLMCQKLLLILCFWMYGDLPLVLLDEIITMLVLLMIFSSLLGSYLLKHKSEVFTTFHLFQQHVECLLNRKIVAIQTNWGGEYERLNSFFIKIGVSHRVSCPHTHQ
jgi:hypothetical protein